MTKILYKVQSQSGLLVINSSKPIEINEIKHDEQYCPSDKCDACIELEHSMSNPCQCLSCDPDGTRYKCTCYISY